MIGQPDNKDIVFKDKEFRTEDEEVAKLIRKHLKANPLLREVKGSELIKKVKDEKKTPVEILEEETKENLPKFPCPYCDQTCANKGALTNHINKKHFAEHMASKKKAKAGKAKK